MASMSLLRTVDQAERAPAARTWFVACSLARVSEVELRDGSRVEIRPLGPDDKEGLTAGFQRLSELSRYRRFLSPTAQLTAKQLAYLTDIDHHHHEALVAIEPSSRAGLGVARYVRSREDAGEAEFAVAVADDWHRRGLGTALARHLAARARVEGITRFTGLVLRENEPMRQLLETLGDIQQRPAGADTIEVSLQIPDQPDAGEGDLTFAGWMRAAATGELESSLEQDGSLVGGEPE
jgi:GNAT superfamily N-acetyltransferase